MTASKQDLAVKMEIEIKEEMLEEEIDDVTEEVDYFHYNEVVNTSENKRKYCDTSIAGFSGTYYCNDIDTEPSQNKKKCTDLQCDECNVKFETLKELKIHILDIHTEYFYCYWCNSINKGKLELENHILDTHTVYQDSIFYCLLCEHSSYTQECVVLHVKQKHEKVLLPANPTKKDDTSDSLNGNNTLNECTYKENSDVAIKIEENRSDSSNDNNTLNECTFKENSDETIKIEENSEYLTENILESDYSNINNTSIENISDNEKEREENLNEAKEIVENSANSTDKQYFTCSYCKIVNKNEIELRYHVSKNHIQITRTSISKYTCGICKFKSISYSDVIEHVLKCHEKVKLPAKSIKKNVDFSYIVNTLKGNNSDKKEKGEENLRKIGENSKNSNELQYNFCSYCKFLSRNELELKNHVSKCHIGFHTYVTNFLCSICSNYTSKYETDAVTHVINMHEKVKLPTIDRPKTKNKLNLSDIKKIVKASRKIITRKNIKKRKSNINKKCEKVKLPSKISAKETENNSKENSSDTDTVEENSDNEVLNVINQRVELLRKCVDKSKNESNLSDDYDQYSNDSSIEKTDSDIETKNIDYKYIYICPFCKMGCDNDITLLKNHIKNDHTLEYKNWFKFWRDNSKYICTLKSIEICKICKNIIKNNKIINTSLTQSNFCNCDTKIENNLQLSYDCNNCTKKFDEKQHYVRHLILIHKYTEKDLDTLKFNGVEKKYFCNVCNTLLNLNDFVYHITKLHKRINDMKDEEKTIGLLYYCEICKKVFRYEDYFDHMNILHNFNKSNVKNPIPLNTKICKFCNMNLSDPNKLIHHIKRIHLGLLYYKCNKCNIHIENMEYLKLHKPTCKSKSKLLNCNKSTNKPKAKLLNRNKPTRKPKSKLLNCNKPTRKPKSKLLNCKEGLFDCKDKDCGLKFKFLRDLKEHIKTNHLPIVDTSELVTNQIISVDTPEYVDVTLIKNEIIIHHNTVNIEEINMNNIVEHIDEYQLIKKEECDDTLNRITNMENVCIDESDIAILPCSTEENYCSPIDFVNVEEQNIKMENDNISDEIPCHFIKIEKVLYDCDPSTI